MSTTFKPLYGTSNQAITITLASLAASATVGRESTVIDNSSNLYLDILLFVMFETGTVAGNKQILLYSYGTADGGTTYTEAATGSDAAFTRKDPTTLRPVAVIPAVTNSFIHKTGPFSLAQAWGGVLPQKLGLVFCNDSGAALSGTAGNNKMFYQGVQAQGV
jgi:hypothetical protein